MAKRRVSKAAKRRLSLFGTLSFIAIVYFCFSLIYNLCMIYDLSMEKKNLEKLYTDLQDQAENLKIDIEKLNDSKYLADYAREHYLYSKDGEYIIQLDEDDIKSVKEDISFEINREYILIGLSIFMLFVFIYILFKGGKNKRS